MSEKYVKLNRTGRDGRGVVATLTVCNEKKLNIVNSAVMDQLLDALATLRNEDDLRVAILCGEGTRAWIGGADINELASLDPDSARVFIAKLHRVCEAIRTLPVPVIARIAGYCLGAGLEIAASCDMRIAAEGSTFGMPEVNVGIPSVIEAALLPQLIGWGKTRELVFTGRSISAAEALQCGLVERVTALDQLDSTLEEWVAGIVNAGPRSIRLQKTLIAQWEKLPLDEAIEAGIDSLSDAYTTGEPVDAMRRFLDRER